MNKPPKSDIEGLLLNWGKWWRDPLRTEESFGHTRSIEHKWLRPKIADAEEAQEKVRRKGQVPNMRDAEMVMVAWKKCSRDTKQILKWTYAMRAEKHISTICRKCGIMQDPPRYRAFDVALYRAHSEIANILASPLVGRASIAPDNSGFSSPQSTTVRSVHPAPCAVRSTPRETEEID